jgi:uncharacterized DUF497 family protein
MKSEAKIRIKMKFAWDEQKNRSNRRKHKVNFSEACLVFADKYALNIYDVEHSRDEERWITMGQTPDGKTLVVVHTYVTIEKYEFVRIISARKATKKEMKQYFERRP